MKLRKRRGIKLIEIQEEPEDEEKTPLIEL